METSQITLSLFYLYNFSTILYSLDKTIQDPKASVRYIGLTILDTNYAQGNEETVNILKQLQNRPDLEYGEDSRLASQILLKMSGQRVEVPDDTPQPEAKQAEEKAA